MSSQLQAPKGVAEYVPPNSDAFLSVREALCMPARNSGYEYVELPVFEDTALFVRGVGQSTDVVSKEMYTFDDRGGRSISLRPEGTAGALRATIEHSLDRGQLPVKLWYAGPFFRAERPQRGRYRQFFSVGIEAIGSEDPALDAEVIAIANDGFRSLGLSDYRLELTSLGDSNCRPAYRELLQEFLRGLDLDPETQARALINPLRVLDDKRQSVIDQMAGAPLMIDHLCTACSEHFDAVRSYLDLLGIAYILTPRLVRGLDYYTRTTFEFSHARLGAQSAIGGGGRYDGLMSRLGGQDLTGIGFGLGVDRTLLAVEAEGIKLAPRNPLALFIVPIGEQAKSQAVRLAGEFRTNGVAVDIAYGDRSLKGAMKAADRSGARFSVVIGERDLANGTAELKDMASGSQETITLEALLPTIKARLL
ncbi:MAG TPA: histidine--tRNA ligase [Candidatus Nanopelagicaceae bacterium]|nr:histidine--tRNA ligase [Candidatus Nanopelagicaceae bacterium]